MAGRVIILLAAVAVAVLGAAPSLGAAGCAGSRCVAHTGKWSIPPNPKMQRQFEGGFKVTYEPTKGKRAPGGNGVKSRYGNTLLDFWVFLPYRCANPDYTWDERAFEFTGPVAIDRHGKLKHTVTVKQTAAVSSPAASDPGVGEMVERHTLTLQFKRKTFTGTVSGTFYRYDGHDWCTTSGKISGTWKSDIWLW